MKLANPKEKKIIVRVDRKTTGEVYKGYFTKVIRRPNEHRLNSPPGWAHDKETFDRLVRPNAHTFRVVDMAGHLIYETSIKHFDEKAFVIDRGYGKQYLLPLNDWTVRSPVQERLPEL